MSVGVLVCEYKRTLCTRCKEGKTSTSSVSTSERQQYIQSPKQILFLTAWFGALTCSAYTCGRRCSWGVTDGGCSGDRQVFWEPAGVLGTGGCSGDQRVLWRLTDVLGSSSAGPSSYRLLLGIFIKLPKLVNILFCFWCCTESW